MNDPKVIVRRVTKDDYSKVMDMFPPKEIYNGRDYLPDYFNMLIDMPNVEAYAAIIDEKCVTFHLYTIIDDGESIVPRAVRTRKEYEGRGIGWIVYDWFLKSSPRKNSFIYQVATIEGPVYKEIMKQLKDGQRHKILERHCRNYFAEGTKEGMKEFQNVVSKASLQSIDKDELGELLSNQNLCYKFFPKGRVFVDWVPYKAIKSNAALMKTERTTVITSDILDPDCALLTFFNYFHAPIGLVCAFDVYGHIGDTLREHVLLHFRNIPYGKGFERVVLRFYCNEDANWNIISDVMNSLGFTKYPVLDRLFTCSKQKIQKSSKL